MNIDNLLTSLSKHMAYWYTCKKGKKHIVFPVDKKNKEGASQLFQDKYQNADVIISEKGEIYCISKEIFCEKDVWSYTYYLKDVQKNYHLKKKCLNLLPYNLKSTSDEKITKIKELNIPSETLEFEIDPKDSEKIKKLIYPFLKGLTYINLKNKKIVAYPDIYTSNGSSVKILLIAYHHQHMDKELKKIKQSLKAYITSH